MPGQQICQGLIDLFYLSCSMMQWLNGFRNILFQCLDLPEINCPLGIEPEFRRVSEKP